MLLPHKPFCSCTQPDNRSNPVPARGAATTEYVWLLLPGSGLRVESQATAIDALNRPATQRCCMEATQSSVTAFEIPDEPMPKSLASPQLQRLDPLCTASIAPHLRVYLS